MCYEPTSQSSFDPYGFKLSPEHSSHTLLDPDEAESPDTSEPDLAYDPEPLSSPPDFDPYSFAITSHGCDPYGFKLSPEEINQEVLDLCAPSNEENLISYDDKELIDSNYSNQEVLGPSENQQSSLNDQLLVDYENQEVLEPSNLNTRSELETVEAENQELFDCGPENQEVLDVFYSNPQELEPCDYENKEVLEQCSPSLQGLHFSVSENQEVLELEQSKQELIDLTVVENQEVLGSHDNHTFPEFDVVFDTDNYGNQEVLSKDLPEANNSRCIQDAELSQSNNSSDSDAVPEHTAVASNNRVCHSLLEEDLGSVFRAGGYVGCPDVADDLEPLNRRQVAPAAEPVQPLRPVRPPRPSLRVRGVIFNTFPTLKVFH